MRFNFAVVASCVSLVALPTNALSLDVDSTDSITSAAKTVAEVLIGQYDGNKEGNPIGIYGLPYYWWSSGAIWDAMVDYWYLTGDETYNDLVYEALLAQVGPGNDFLPPNQTATIGNDDQSIWAMAALTAAERNFKAPPSDSPSWLEIATNTFEEQVARWDTDDCDGGLRWQILPLNAGYDYKNSLSNGNFFQLAARLAKFTGNQTYAQWAETTYQWLTNIGFVDETGSVFDGAHTENGCSNISKAQFTSNAGIVLYGTAVMYNITGGNSTWRNATITVLDRSTSTFFEDDVVSEVACEDQGMCTIDMHFFKGIFVRDLARTAATAPFVADTIKPLLKSSAKAAASTACTNSNGSCEFSWQGSDEGNVQDVGSQFSALEVIQSILSPSGSLVSAGNETGSGNGTTTSGNNSTGGQSNNGTSQNAAGSLQTNTKSAIGYTAVLLAIELLVTGIL